MANYFKGDDLRSYFHSFGRAFTAKGQNFLDQAPLKSGHTVSTSDVRAEAVPYIDANFKLQTEFMGVASGTPILTGTKGSRTVIPALSGILKFYDGVALTEMSATNGETFQLIDGVVIKGLMDPTDQYDSTGKKTADGYTIKVLKGDGTPIPMSEGWVVDPVNGAVTFENGKTPAVKAHGAIKIEAFAYVGKYTSTVLTSQNSRLAAVETQLGMGGGTAGGSVVEQIETISGILSSFSGVGSVSAAIGDVDAAIEAETAARIAADNFLSGAIDDISGIIDNTSITGVSAIAVNTVDHASTVSLVIDPADKVLTQSNAGLLTNISLVKLGTATTGYAATYALSGISGQILGDKINIPKDQFLKDAEFIAKATQADVDASGKEVELDKPCIKFTFEIKKKAENGIVTDVDHIVYVNVNGLVDTYTAGNGIDITSNVISVKKDTDSESFLTVTSAGVAVTGVSAAIADAVADAIDVVTGFVIDKAYATIEYVDAQDSILSGAIDSISAYVSGIPGDIDNVINPKIEFLSGAIDDEVAARIEADDKIRLEITERFQTLNNQLSGLNDAMAILVGNIEALKA